VKIVKARIIDEGNVRQGNPTLIQGTSAVVITHGKRRVPSGITINGHHHGGIGNRYRLMIAWSRAAFATKHAALPTGKSQTLGLQFSYEPL
jgi:hypothetical protein